MIFSSGKYLGDTGKYWNCLRKPEQGLRYSLTQLDLSKINTTHINEELHDQYQLTNITVPTLNCSHHIAACNFGLCSPNKCTPADVRIILDSVIFFLIIYIFFLIIHFFNY